MNNFKKIGVTALAGSLAMTAASAVEYSMSGDAIIKFASSDSPKAGQAKNGKGIGVDTDLAFTASGDLDNGMTVSFFQAADTNGAWSNSSSQVTIGMGSMGTLQFNNISGSKANGIDDVMPAAYNETWDGFSAVAGDNPSDFGASTASGSVDYRIPAQEIMGATINASITLDPNADEGAPAAGAVGTTSVSGTAYTLEIAHESGLSIGGGQETIDNGGALGGDEENVTAYAKFAMGPITIGYQEAYQNSANGGEDNESEFMGVSYTAGDISVSYGESSITNHGIAVTTQVERELDSIQFAYTMGAMTISGGVGETSNSGGIAGQTHEESELAVSFAF